MRNNTILLFSLFFLLCFHTEADADSLYRLIKRGNRYYKRELYKDALNYYSQGKSVDDKSSVPSFNEGAALYKLEDFSGSIQSFSEALELIEDEERRADIYYNLGNSYFKRGDYHKAVESYTQVLSTDPHNFDAKYNLELAWEKLKEQKKADQSRDQESKDRRASEGDQEREKEAGDQKGDQNVESGEGISDESADAQKDFTPEEAKRLFDSIKSDQTQIIADIIKKKASKEENAKDW